MIEKLAFLSSFGTFYSGTGVGRVLDTWQRAGVFDYLLPFLLIFSIVFLLITRIEAFKDNKSVSGIIALATALMALQLDMVPRFFSEIFPRVGVGIAIILVLLITVGVFTDPEKGVFTGIFFTVGIIIFLVIIYHSFSSFNDFFSTSNWWNEYGAATIGSLILLAIIGAIIAGGGSSDDSGDSPKMLVFGKK